MCKLKFYWFEIWMTTNEKNRKNRNHLKKRNKKLKEFFKVQTVCVLRPIQIHLHRM